jgi:hypothetical protein
MTASTNPGIGRASTAHSRTKYVPGGIATAAAHPSRCDLACSSGLERTMR